MKSLQWSFAAATLVFAGSAHASLYPLPQDGSAVVGRDSNVTTVYEDTLPDIAHRYSLGSTKSSAPIPAWTCGCRARANS